MDRGLHHTDAWRLARVGVALWVCAPPYERMVPLAPAGNDADPVSPPLGAVVYAAGPCVLAALEQLAIAIAQWPWVAPCIGLPPSEYVAEEYAALRRPFGGRLAVVPLRAGREVAPRELAAAVARRPPPSAGALAGWIVTRVEAQDLATPLVERLGHALGERSGLPRSRSWYSRVFAPHRGLRATDWERLATLVDALRQVARGHDRGRAVGSFGNGRARSERTLNTYAITYLGRTWSSASQCVGWEWVLEAALRKQQRARAVLT